MKKIIFLLAMLTITCSVQAQDETSTSTLEKQWYTIVGDIEYQINLSSEPFNGMDMPVDLDETISASTAEAIWTADSAKFPVNKNIYFNVVLLNQTTYNLDLSVKKFIECFDCFSPAPWKETQYFAYVRRIGKVTPMAQK